MNVSVLDISEFDDGRQALAAQQNGNGNRDQQHHPRKHRINQRNVAPGNSYQIGRQATAEIEQWQEQPEQARFDCPECGRSLSATELRWRKCAGFGRFFIKVWGIFESEAVPNPNLLAILEKSTGTAWQHFYVRHL